ncbi:hemolysin family protein [uncultured Ruminococcus sp.]|uniref:hemolysin family protein n=1 Tax=uncultured Ruminococcus sp. TaxID=165186 RepID=UPI00292E1E09|nr:hemolysin family protein [uncultured Ruminococcus sp.]
MPDDLSGAKKEKSFIERLFGSKDNDTKQAQTEEEILSLVEEGQEKGLIEDDTKDIIENVFDFDDTVAYEIMTHRRDMTSLEDTDDLETVVDVAIRSGHSRIPVWRDDIDNIIGILYVKDLLKFVGKPAPAGFRLSAVLRPALFVPRTKDCRSLFSFMKKNKTQIAVVVDEYGGTEGIITLEDLIEDILGNIQDEYDNEEDEIRRLSDGKFTVDGSTSIEDVEELIGTELSDDDSETIAGFILSNLGRIPAAGEHPSVETEGLRFTAAQTDGRRITEVLIERL